MGFPSGSDSKKIHLQCKRPGFHPWVGKIPWRSKRLLTPVNSPGEFHGQRNLEGYIVHRVAKSWTQYIYHNTYYSKSLGKNSNFLSSMV